MNKMHAEERLKSELCKEALEKKWLRPGSSAAWQNKLLGKERSVSVQLEDGSSFRLLNILDDCNHEGLGSEVDFSIPAERVISMLNYLIEWRGKPNRIRYTIALNTSKLNSCLSSQE